MTRGTPTYKGKGKINLNAKERAALRTATGKKDIICRERESCPIAESCSHAVAHKYLKTKTCTKVGCESASTKRAYCIDVGSE